MTPEKTKLLNYCKEITGELRRESFGLAVEWILNNVSPPSILVETGRTRSDGEGKSTVILALLAKALKVKFVSVDFDPTTVDTAKLLFEREKLVDWNDYATLAVADSTATLASLTYPISFCYLDSARSPDLELQEASALVGKMTTPAAILIDDCNPDGGKSVLSVPFLQERGWKLVFSGFQRFLTLS